MKGRDETNRKWTIHTPRIPGLAKRGKRGGKREYQGEDAAKDALRFLNSRPSAEISNRPLELLKLLQEYASRISAIRPGAPTANEHPEWGLLHAKINEILSHWAGSQALVRTSKPGPGMRFETHVSVVATGNSPEPILEWLAIQGCLELASVGAIHRIKNCAQCQRWFFARFARGDRCQKLCDCCAATWRRSPEYREYNRVYMKGYRRRDTKAAAKAQAAAKIAAKRGGK